MVAVFEFDETESIESILDRYSVTCTELGIQDPERTSGQELVRCFHSTIDASVRLGNQARLEKLIQHGNTSLRIVGLPHSQRGGLKRLIARMLGRS